MLATLALLASVGFEPLFVRDLSRAAIDGTAKGRANAKPAVGRFPIVIFFERNAKQSSRGAATASVAESPSGDGTNRSSRLRATPPPRRWRLHGTTVIGRYRAPSTNSILAERIASHGFVVIGIPLLGSLELDYENSVAGIETAVADIRVALDRVARRPYADATKVSLIGVGIAANINAAYAARNPDVDALVSLDGGITSPFEVSLMRRTPYFDPAALRALLLVIESPFDGQDRSLLSDFRYADKTLVRFPSMKEFHYLNHGALEPLFPGLLGQAPPRAGESFDLALRHIVAFLGGPRARACRPTWS